MDRKRKQPISGSTKKLSIDEIKNLYGCKTYKQTANLKLA